MRFVTWATTKAGACLAAHLVAADSTSGAKKLTGWPTYGWGPCCPHMQPTSAFMWLPCVAACDILTLNKNG
jgi:hypothetical protein